MSKPTEHKTVQARILAYAQEIGWTLVSRAEAERRRGFEPTSPSGLRGSSPDATTAEERARRASLYFGDLLHGQLRTFNPLYQKAEGESIGQWQRLPSSIAGNRDFLTILRLTVGSGVGFFPKESMP